MSIDSMRTGFRRWLRRPAGMLVLVLLLLALVAGNTVRAQIHVHAHGEDPHVFHVQDLGHHVSSDGHDQHDHWLGHGSGGDAGHGAGQPDEEPPVHIHIATVASTLVPAVAGIPPVVFTTLPVAAGFTGVALAPSPPSELFRPPIA